MSISLPTSASSDGVSHDEPDATTTVNQTVKFHDDDDVEVKTFPRYVSIGESFRDSAIGAREHDIRDFLGRPVLCSSGTFASTNTAGTQLKTIPLPSACLANSSYADKLRGFYGFRAKMVCRVQINAQRFQQGRLLLHYLPQTATMDPSRLASALSSLVFITQQPRVDMDINKDTEVMLEIPYVSNSMYYSMMDGSYDFGTFYLTVYAPLQAGSGALSCTYTIWCHFEDVEIAYPAVSQSGIKILRGRGKGASRVDVSDQELAVQGLGPISSLMKKGSNAAAILSEIPLISAFTAPTSWALGILGRAADALGYSKPTSAGASEKRMLTTFAYMNNTNAVDNSAKLAVRSDNAVVQLPGFAGTDIDELDIAYLVSIPSWQITQSWSTAAAQGSSIAGFGLYPSNFSAISLTTGGVTYPLRATSVMGYIANGFSLWRGSITLTIKIVKTEFHSGRLLIAFFPGRNTTGGASFANTQYVYREILDLRKSSEISITFPWTCLTPYLPITQTYGVAQIYVLNPLVAPSTVAQQVDCIFEISGAPDIEFAAPQTAPFIPVVFNPQSGLGLQAKPIESVMDNSTLKVALEPAMFCIGERVQSIRQMIKRFSTSFVGTTTTTSTTMVLTPQINYVPLLGFTAGKVTLSAGFAIDQLSYYAPLFRFWRGSTRVKIIDPGTNTALVSSVGFNNNTTNLSQSLPISFPTTVPTTNLCLDQPTVVVPSLSGGAEYEVPYYSITHASHPVVVNGNVAGVARDITDNQLNLYVTQNTVFSPQTRVFRAAGDDYSLGFFIGTLPLTSSTLI